MKCHASRRSYIGGGEVFRGDQFPFGGWMDFRRGVYKYIFLCGVVPPTGGGCEIPQRTHHQRHFVPDFNCTITIEVRLCNLSTLLVFR